MAAINANNLIDAIKELNLYNIKHCPENEVLTDYFENRDNVYYLIEGEADLIKYDSQGNQYLLQHYYDNDVFGEIFHTIKVSGEYSVIAHSECSYLSFSASYLLAQLTHFDNGEEIMAELLHIISNKFEQLNFQIELLRETTIRNRLLTYFNYLASRNYQRVFYIPMTYSQMADYLNINRSAMMREIKYLEEDRLIDRKRYRIRLLTNQ